MRNLVTGVLAVVIAAAVSGGCSSAVNGATAGTGAPPFAPPTVTPTTLVATTVAPTTVAPASAPTTTVATGLVVASGHGWTPEGLEGTMPAPGACHYGSAVYQDQAQPLPDPSCTPGGVDSTVTQANLAQTLCRAGGYTDSVRPPESLTEPAKQRSALSYRVTGALSGYEYDHLVPLEIGGASDVANLWPEQDIGGRGGYLANAKDSVEDALHDAVCSGKVTLSAAQQAIARNWTTALAVLGLPT